MSQEQIQQLISIGFSILTAAASLIIVFLKTRTATLERKLKQPVTLKGKCILFYAPDGKKYVIDLDEETILSKGDISFELLKEFIDLDKEKKEE